VPSVVASADVERSRRAFPPVTLPSEPIDAEFHVRSGAGSVELAPHRDNALAMDLRDGEIEIPLSSAVCSATGICTPDLSSGLSLIANEMIMYSSKPPATLARVLEDRVQHSMGQAEILNIKVETKTIGSVGTIVILLLQLTTS